MPKELVESSQLQNWDSEVDGLAFNVQVLGTDDQAANHRIPLLTPFLLYLYRYTLFYTAASVHSTAKQLLQIICASLAHRKSFHVMPSEGCVRTEILFLDVIAVKIHL